MTTLYSFSTVKNNRCVKPPGYAGRHSGFCLDCVLWEPQSGERRVHVGKCYNSLRNEVLKEDRLGRNGLCLENVGEASDMRWQLR